MKTNESVEILKKWADAGIGLALMAESYYLAAGDGKNAEKAAAFGKFAKSGKELLMSFE